MSKSRPAFRPSYEPTDEFVTEDKPCGHPCVIGSFDDMGCHLRNRCQDCGYTVEWAT